MAIADFAPDEIYHLAAYHRSWGAQVSLTDNRPPVFGTTFVTGWRALGQNPIST